jgi:hypothetical protein
MLMSRRRGKTSCSISMQSNSLLFSTGEISDNFHIVPPHGLFVTFAVWQFLPQFLVLFSTILIYLCLTYNEYYYDEKHNYESDKTKLHK